MLMDLISPWLNLRYWKATCLPPLPEASCSSQIETARAVVSEMGTAASHKSGINDWAKVENKNSERDVSRIVQKHGTKLQIPITEMSIRDKAVPWINPRHWLEYIVKHGLLYMLSGLPFEQRDRVGDTWKSFWTRYEQLNPMFDIFLSDNFNPSATIGLFLHGDEGRTLKKGGLMVTSIQSTLGYGFDRKRLKRPWEEGALSVNFTGHTCLSRFVTSVLPKTEYQADAEFFHLMMDEFSGEMKRLLQDGIPDPVSGLTYKFCIIGVKGDMPYLQKVGRLKRSWNTTIKRGKQRKEPPGVCHLCLAGTRPYPCEDMADSPHWQSTIGVKPPFDVTPGVLKILPHDRDDPGSFFKADVWHCIHLGCGKSFIASTIQLALDYVPASNNDDRFAWLTKHYIAWCRKVRTSTLTSKISAYLMSYNDSTGASGNWSKGSLTTNLMKWLVALLTDLKLDDEGLLLRARECARGLNVALSMLYNSQLFLEMDDIQFIYKRGMAFLQGYSWLAEQAFARGKWHLYPLFPKLHACHHVFMTLYREGQVHGFGLNPLTASCQQDEDTVGRLSRTSRRVNIRQVCLRTLQRHLMTCYKIWTDSKIITWAIGKRVGWEEWKLMGLIRKWLANM